MANAATVSPLIELKQAAKQKLILQKAAELFARYGFRATSMDQLAAEVRMNKATLYYYCSAKSELLFRICDEVLHTVSSEATQAVFMPTTEHALRYLVEMSERFSRTHQKEITVLYQEAPHRREYLTPEQIAQLEVKERAYMKTIYVILQRGIDCGDLRPFDVKIVGRLIASLFNAHYRRSLGVPPDIKIEDVIGDLILHGLKAR